MPSTVLPATTEVLEEMAHSSAPGSDSQVDAAAGLAELLADSDPWRASRYAKESLAHRDDANLWAVLGWCQDKLGNLAYAARAYSRAAELAPANPFHLHNEASLRRKSGDKATALTLSARAHSLVPRNITVAKAYAKALLEAGNEVQAVKVLGACAGVARQAAARTPETEAEKNKLKQHVYNALVAHLSPLPLQDAVREGVFKLAAEAFVHVPPANTEQDARAFAAAVAWLLAEASGSPLRAREVTACFRVPAASAKAHCVSVQQALAVCPGDARYLPRA